MIGQRPTEFLGIHLQDLGRPSKPYLLKVYGIFNITFK